MSVHDAEPLFKQLRETISSLRQHTAYKFFPLILHSSKECLVFLFLRLSQNVLLFSWDHSSLIIVQEEVSDLVVMSLIRLSRVHLLCIRKNEIDLPT